MIKLQIKTGDEVIVIAGKNKGKKGKVVQTLPKLNRVVVEGVNMTKRHLRSRRNEDKGQVVEFAMPIHASNVQPVGSNGKAMRHVKARKTA
jgi:large subunit ribosomal protein L24